VGAAAAKTVVVSASPQTLNSSGGQSTISARVLNANGSALSGVPVTFTADNGTLSASTQITDNSGVANVVLTTSRETKVTATVSGDVKADVTVKLNPRVNVTITPPTTQPTAGVASTYTIGVGTNANVTNVRVAWGDGTTNDLGAISGNTAVTHTYSSDGTYTITATAFDASGSTESVSNSVSVLPQQPPTVDLTVSPTTPHVGDQVLATARVSGNTTAIQNYTFNFGDGPNSILSGNSNTARYTYTTTGARTITVTVTQAPGQPTGQAQASVTVIP
jgi:hypothetical protein